MGRSRSGPALPNGNVSAPGLTSRWRPCNTIGWLKRQRIAEWPRSEKSGPALSGDRMGLQVPRLTGRDPFRPGLSKKTRVANWMFPKRPGTRGSYRERRAPGLTSRFVRGRLATKQTAAT
jgi:hypothetical protein